MFRRMMFSAIAAAAFVTPAAVTQTALAQTSTSPTGPAFSACFFTTPLENDPSREVRLQMQIHLPGRQGNPFHTHNGDQWEAVIEGEITSR
jgi:quercetin dioxygenase-like cupin family protein